MAYSIDRPGAQRDVSQSLSAVPPRLLYLHVKGVEFVDLSKTGVLALFFDILHPQMCTFTHRCCQAGVIIMT